MRTTAALGGAPSRPKITFARADAAGFARTVRREVARYFTERGLSDKANATMVVKTITLLSLTFVPYALILRGTGGPWGMLGLAILMGVGLAGIGFSISHDGLHGAYSDKPWVNKLIGLTFDLVGASGYMWKITHNVIHHTYTNIQGVDEDLEVSPLLRLSPHSELRWFHRWQHLYAFFAYSLSTINWIFVKDYQQFLRKDLGPYQNRKHPTGAIVGLFVGKAVHYGWAIAVPLLVAPVTWWQFVIGFLAMHMTAGLILGIIFQLAHVVEETAQHDAPPSGMMEDEWMVHEMHTTANFARRNRLLGWYVGGLNFQVEHHLFPKVCSVHYEKICDIVERVAKAHNVPYHAAPTFLGAVRSHYRMLRTLGWEAWLARRAGSTESETLASAPVAA